SPARGRAPNTRPPSTISMACQCGNQTRAPGAAGGLVEFLRGLAGEHAQLCLAHGLRPLTAEASVHLKRSLVEHFDVPQIFRKFSWVGFVVPSIRPPLG